MNRPGLSARDRRALGILAAIMAAVLLWRVAMRPLIDEVVAVRTEVANERAAWAADLALIAAVADRPTEASGGVSGRVRASLLGGPGRGLAEAALAAQVGDLARQHRVLVTGMQPTPGDTLAADLRRVTLRVRCETDFEGILSLLAAMEQDPRLLVVDHLRIEAVPGSAAVTETLVAQFTVSGFIPAGHDGGERP